MNVSKIDRAAFNLDAEGTFVGPTPINKWLSLVFFLGGGEGRLLQCGRVEELQELVRARAPPGMSHPSSSPPPNSPDQTPQIRTTFVQTDQYLREIGLVYFKVDEYFKPNQCLWYFIISTVLVLYASPYLAPGGHPIPSHTLITPRCYIHLSRYVRTSG